MEFKRKRSIIWNFFTPKNDTEATCNLCKFSCKYKSSISNLKSHMTRKHPTINISIEPRSAANTSDVQQRSCSTTNPGPIQLPETDFSKFADQEPSASTSSSIFHPKKIQKIFVQSTIHEPKKIGFTQQRQIDNSLLKLITNDFQPFSIVENKGFREYTHALNPHYNIPSRKKLSKTLLPAKYEETYNVIKDVAKDVVSFTLTTDCWTSCNNESFMAVTIHFIDSSFELKSVLLDTSIITENHNHVNLAKKLREVLSEWDLPEKNVLMAISDNASNIKKAIIDELKWRHFGCYAHTLNLIAHDALKFVKPLIDKVKTIVAHFKRSSVAKNRLDLYQKQGGKEPKKMIQSVDTRWNSEYYMLERMKELQDEVRATLATIANDQWPMISNEEFDEIKQLIKILGPLESATKLMSGEKYVTMSSVIILTNGLKDAYNTMLRDTQFLGQSKEVIKLINDGILSRLGNLESSTTFIVSSFLDPRFKNIGFSSDNTAERAKSSVIDILTSMINVSEVQEPQEASQPEATDSTDNYSSLWTFFDKKALAFQPTGTSRSRAIIEVQRYLEEPLLHRSLCPITWWKSNAYNYPNLSKVVRQKFGTVATSVPCERIFSKTGQLLSDRRNRLSHGNVKKIMFVNQNST